MLQNCIQSNMTLDLSFVCVNVIRVCGNNWCTLKDVAHSIQLFKVIDKCAKKMRRTKCV